MIYHTAYFWLKPNLNKEELLNFEKGLQSLQGISLVKDGNYGSPAATLKDQLLRTLTVTQIYWFLMVLKTKINIKMTQCMLLL